MGLDFRWDVFHIVCMFALASVLSVCFSASGVHARENRWTAIRPEGGSITVLTIDPHVSTTIYAGTAGSGIFKSVDGGENWVAANTGLENPYIQALAIDPHTPGTLYAGTGSAVFKSTDGGASWAIANTSFSNGFDAGVTTLAIDPTASGTLYAGTGSQGLFKSTDGAARKMQGHRRTATMQD